MCKDPREGDAAHRADVPTSRMQSRYWVVNMSDKTYIPPQHPSAITVRDSISAVEISAISRFTATA